MDAMKTCREILARAHSNFAPAFAVLPRDQRDAMTAFYAFCRVVDDAVDDAGDAASARAAIGEWRRRVARLGTGSEDDPVCVALGTAVRRLGIRRDHLSLILDGVEQDLAVTRYPTFADLYEYCYRVASAVGLVCVTVLGRRTRDVEAYAELTGIAVQLTNIVRDVDEDARMGRIYLPIEDLERFGVGEEEVLERRMTARMRTLLRFEAFRARQFYDLSDAALPGSARADLYFAEALKEIYRRLLDRICQTDFPGFGAKVSVPKGEKIAIVLKHRLSPSTLLGAVR